MLLVNYTNIDNLSMFACRPICWYSYLDYTYTNVARLAMSCQISIYSAQHTFSHQSPKTP